MSSTKIRGFTCRNCGTVWKFQTHCPRCDRKSKELDDPVVRIGRYQDLGNGGWKTFPVLGKD